jgi:hypothetical protein
MESLAETGVAFYLCVLLVLAQRRALMEHCCLLQKSSAAK